MPKITTDIHPLLHHSPPKAHHLSLPSDQSLSKSRPPHNLLRDQLSQSPLAPHNLYVLLQLTRHTEGSHSWLPGTVNQRVPRRHHPRQLCKNSKIILPWRAQLEPLYQRSGWRWFNSAHVLLDGGGNVLTLIGAGCSHVQHHWMTSDQTVSSTDMVQALVQLDVEETSVALELD